MMLEKAFEPLREAEERLDMVAEDEREGNTNAEIIGEMRPVKSSLSDMD